MTISSAMSNALSGLTASTRAAEVVSNNVSNALTEGYARRALDLSSRSFGGQGAGVRIEGVSRLQHRTLLADRRLADAAAGNTGLRTEFLARVEGRIGTSDADGSLTARVATLESALIAAAARPDSEAALRNVLGAANGLAGHLQSVSDDIQAARMEADGEIARQVETVNTDLQRIDDLNSAILVQTAAGGDATALMDQRQILVDRVATIIPLREVPREGSQVALFTTGGAVLLDGTPARIGFSRVGVVTADMTQASGALSGLTINDRPVRTSEDGVMGGGTLGALFAIRDDLAVGAQAQLDALARDLIDRFADPAVDGTLAAADAGLFTDRGAPLDPADEAGLAGRIAVNALVDPARGGALWHLRDGLGATGAGPVGAAETLQALADALGARRVPASGNFMGVARSASGLAADMLSSVSIQRQQSEDATAFSEARQSTLAVAVAADGVDTDAEMQHLLLIEQSYTANAKVISALDQMLRQIMEI